MFQNSMKNENVEYISNLQDFDLNKRYRMKLGVEETKRTKQTFGV